MTVRPSRRAQPPTIASSSRNVAVAVQLDEIGESQSDVVERVRPLGVPRQLHALERSKAAVHFRPHALSFASSFSISSSHFEPVLIRELLQVADLQLELRDLGVGRWIRSAHCPRTSRTPSVPKTMRSSASSASLGAT